MLEQEPAFCIQVDKHRGRTFGHGASGTGVSEPGGDGLTTVLLVTEVVEVMPPVGVFGTHLPSLSSSVSLQDRAEVVATGVEEEGVVLVRLVMPPVGFFGTHLPSFNSSLSLQDTAEVVVTGVVAAGVVLVVTVTPPVGVFGTHLPSLSSSVSLQDTAEVVATGVVVVTPPVGV